MIIVGAGPAGSSLAIRLRRAGRDVLLVDKADFPRDKLCGEFVSPECLEHFEQLSVLPQILAAHPASLSRTLFYSTSGRSVAVENTWLSGEATVSIGISRKLLDNILLQKAEASGAAVRTGSTLLVVNLEHGSAHELVFRDRGGTSFAAAARVIVDATGRGRYLARKFESRPPVKPRQVAFKTHVTGAAISRGACELFSYRGGYGGCLVVEDGLFDLCFVTDASLARSIGGGPERVMAETILRNPRAGNVLAHAEFEHDWLSVPIAKYGMFDPAPAPGVLAVGDAAAFIDPFTGSGIALALESSRLAADAIVTCEDPAAIAATYRRVHAAAFRRRLALCRVLRLVTGRRPVADAAIGLLSASSSMTRFLARATRSGASTPGRSDA